MKSKKSSLALLFTVVALIAAAFGTATGSASSTARKEVTFSKDVAPIFFKDCASCHRPNDIAPMSLLTFKEARPWARSIKEKVVTREMPPWSPDPKIGEFSNDHRLSQKDIDTIVAWVDQGAKEGNPKDLPKVPEMLNGGWEIGKPDAVLTMAEEYTVEVNAPDNYINFFIPTNFKEDKWIQAAEVHPGNKRVVHHVIAFIQTPEMIARMKAAGGRRRGADRAPGIFYKDGTLSRVKMDAPVVDDGCSAPKGAGGGGGGEGEGGGGGTLLAGFAPGMGPSVWAPGTAKKVPAGSVLMFQMHYSSFRGQLTEAQKDRTSIGLVFAKEPPAKAIHTMGIMNAMFKIPAGAENHEVTACQTVQTDIQLVSYMPHMHLRGKDMKYEVVYPDGKRETLLWVPKFNFNWQTQYYLKKPVMIPKGSKLIITAHFDNSKKNKYNPSPEKDVRWGDPTYDEMMIGWVDFMTPNQAKSDVAAKASGK